MKEKVREFYENNKEAIESFEIAAVCAISIAGSIYGGYKIGRASAMNDVSKGLGIMFSVNPHLKEVLTETIIKMNSKG